MTIDKFIFLWVAEVTLVFAIFAKKPADSGQCFAKLIAWYGWPLWLIGCIIFGALQRKKMRWLKRKWLIVTLKFWSKWMINGMMDKL